MSNQDLIKKNKNKNKQTGIKAKFASNPKSKILDFFFSSSPQ
jgi:hypothetical protein